MAFRLEIQQANQLRKLNFVVELRKYITYIQREQAKLNRTGGWFGSRPHEHAQNSLIESENSEERLVSVSPVVGRATAALGRICDFC
jgi:hypothetical protein